MASKKSRDVPQHDWSGASRVKVGGTKISEEEDVEKFEHVLFASEAERLVEDLERFSLKEVGCQRWVKQHAALEKLKQQAHASAAESSDEFVLESLVTFDKLKVLAYDLVLTEAWRERVFPRLKKTICDRKRTTRAYFILYHEASLVNFFQLICYHGHVLAAMKDSVVDLIDYVARRLAALQCRADEFREAVLAADNLQQRSAKEVAEAIAKTTPEEEITRQARDIEFSLSVACVSLARYLAQHLADISVSGCSRLLDHHDLLLSVVPLVENPPWTRAKMVLLPTQAPTATKKKTQEDGGVEETKGEEEEKPKVTKKTRVWQKLDEKTKEWKTVPKDQLLKVTSLEAQAWLATYSLVMHPEVRKRYGFDTFRKQTLLRARRFMNDVLLDQIPALADLQRFMDELALVDAPQPTALADRGGFVLQQVAAEQERALKGQDFQKIADSQLDTIWATGSNDSDLAMLVDVYSPDEPGSEEYQASIKNLLDDNKLKQQEEEKGVSPPSEKENKAPPLIEELPPKKPPTQETKMVQEISSAEKKVFHEEEEKKVADEGQERERDATVSSVEVTAGDVVVIYERTPASAKIVPSPDGRNFCRTKWTSEEDDLSLAPGAADLVINVAFASGRQETLTATDDLLDLANAPSTLWKQVGDIEDDLAAQVFLKANQPSSYRLPCIYLSTPVVDYRRRKQQGGLAE